MQVLLKQVKIVDSSSSHNGQIKDVLITDGHIEAIRNRISHRGKRIQVEGAHLSPGWTDIGAFVGDPGLEHIETLESLAAAGARGGYTTVAVLPNTHPPLHSKSEIEYIRTKSGSQPTAILPIGSVTKNCDGQEIAEMLDMHHAGAVAFSDGERPVQRAGVLLKGLEYLRAFDGTILNRPATEGLLSQGLIHEGRVSVSLGLRGLPSLSEVMMVKRDIDLLRYSQSRLHLLNVSCAESVALVKAAKAEGLNLTCSVPALNLVHTEDDLSDFNVNYKVLPPLRTESDRQALLAGVKSGIIDCVTSNHRPVHVEGKSLEFAYAEFGISSIEVSFSLIYKALGKPRNLAKLVAIMAQHPKKVLGLPFHSLERGNAADLTLFQPKSETIVRRQNMASKSKNSPFIGMNLPGRVLGVINGDRHALFH